VARSGRRQPPDRRALDPVQHPLGQSGGAERCVERERRLVPVERRPLQPRAVALRGDAGDVREQRPADAGAASGRADEQVFEPDAGPSGERREGREEERVAGGLAVAGLRDQRLGARPLAEEVLREQRSVATTRSSSPS
jgi:hypothetical protein